jgi:hypothetical protein
MEKTAENIDQLVQDFLILMITNDIDWAGKPDANKWSKKEIIGHLIDSANNNLNRFVRCTYEQNFKLVYAQNEWVAAQHYQDAKVEDLLTLWRLLNKQISTVIKNYPEQLLQNTCDTGRQEVNLRTVEFLANDYVAHLEHHLKQIITI